MFKTQAEWIIEELDTHGQISRNKCLARRITRLASVINVLNNLGWEIKGYWDKTMKKQGRDYLYVMTKNKPKKWKRI